MLKGVENVLNATGKVIETAPTLYDDVIKPTAIESGKTLSLIPRIINAALSPLEQWIASKEYNIAETKILLAQKLEHVGEDKIVTPEPFIAIPAMQSLSYSMNSEELRNLYANLLAKSMNIETKSLVHPAFLEIIKQLSPIDAYVMRQIDPSNMFPVVSISVKEYSTPINANNILQDLEYPKNSYSYNDITYIEDFSYPEIGASINNLTRLGLIEELMGNKQNKVYEKIFETNTYISLKKQLDEYVDSPNKKFEIYYHTLFLNNFSRLFRQVCIQDL